MLLHASELLSEFIKQEKKVLADIDMKHMPTLGSGYEEITKQGLMKNFSIPKALNLRVESGFISINGAMQAQQIDCMLVHGEGMRYGLTSEYIYDIEKVLCIFEVKKTLRKADLADAIDHLSGLRRKFEEYFDEKIKNGHNPNISQAAIHFSQITGKEAPSKYSEIDTLAPEDAIVFYTLMQELIAPLSIIHGYGGYKTEEGLRNAFVEILDENIKTGKTGYGIPSLPSLITANDFSLIKAGGVPWIVNNGNNDWVPIVSCRHNPALSVLELVWSKISSYFSIKMPWDDGVYMKQCSSFANR
ncbi:DUF6602 domain-containing protein [Buttiauxella agrestis]